jgi:hypothetical protein
MENGAFKGATKFYENIQFDSTESWVLHGSASRQNFFIMSAFFAVSAAAKLGKLFVDGIREIEVTRMNARTELSYQTHNWLTQDPAFHEIAETEALNDALTQLERDLPALSDNRPLLKQRIRTILLNVGRNSAPPYYLMTPLVGLKEARG